MADADAEQPQRWFGHALFGLNVLYSRIFYAQMGLLIAPYLFSWFLAAALLAWLSGWTRHAVWMHVYATLLAQTLCDSLGILLPQGFVLYALVPLVLVGAAEVAVVAALRSAPVRAYAGALAEKGARGPAPPKLVRVVAGIYTDADVRRWYAPLFEAYMTLCSCVLALRGSFMRAPCFAAAYTVLVGLFFLAVEDMRDTRAAHEFPLPSAAVKAVYALYAPVRFQQPLMALAALVLVVGCSKSDAPVARAIAAVAVATAAVATVFHRELDACFL